MAVIPALPPSRARAGIRPSMAVIFLDTRAANGYNSAPAAPMAISPNPVELNAYWLEFPCPREGLPPPGPPPSSVPGPCCSWRGWSPASAALVGRLLAELGGECRPAPAAGPAGRTAVRLAGGGGPLGRLAERLRREAPQQAAVAAAIEECLRPRRRELRLGSRVLDFRRRTHVMGILNVTPDSFFPASRVADLGPAVERALEMAAAGADLLDVGRGVHPPGRRPGGPAGGSAAGGPADPGDPPPLAGALSVDTRHAGVARQALEAGADLLNDISGLSHDPGMAALAVESGAPVVLMHMRGDPQTMQQRAQYADTVGEVMRELRRCRPRRAGGGHRPAADRRGPRDRLRQAARRTTCACWRTCPPSAPWASRCWWACRASPSSARSPAGRWKAAWRRRSPPTSWRCSAGPTSCACTTWRKRSRR